MFSVKVRYQQISLAVVALVNISSLTYFSLNFHNRIRGKVQIKVDFIVRPRFFTSFPDFPKTFLTSKTFLDIKGAERNSRKASKQPLLVGRILYLLKLSMYYAVIQRMFSADQIYQSPPKATLASTI